MKQKVRNTKVRLKAEKWEGRGTELLAGAEAGQHTATILGVCSSLRTEKHRNVHMPNHILSYL